MYACVCINHMLAKKESSAMFYAILRADANAFAAWSNICNTFFEMTFYPKRTFVKFLSTLHKFVLSILCNKHQHHHTTLRHLLFQRVAFCILKKLQFNWYCINKYGECAEWSLSRHELWFNRGCISDNERWKQLAKWLWTVIRGRGGWRLWPVFDRRSENKPRTDNPIWKTNRYSLVFQLYFLYHYLCEIMVTAMDQKIYLSSSAWAEQGIRRHLLWVLQRHWWWRSSVLR